MLLAAILTAESACHDVSLERSLGAACESHTDCRDPYVCALGACRIHCEIDGDCPGGACLFIDETTRVCTVGGEQSCEPGAAQACPPGFECSDPICRNRCDDKHSCHADRKCIDGTCHDVDATT